MCCKLSVLLRCFCSRAEAGVPVRSEEADMFTRASASPRSSKCALYLLLLEECGFGQLPLLIRLGVCLAGSVGVSSQTAAGRPACARLGRAARVRVSLGGFSSPNQHYPFPESQPFERASRVLSWRAGLGQRAHVQATKLHRQFAIFISICASARMVASGALAWRCRQERVLTAGIFCG